MYSDAVRETSRLEGEDVGNPRPCRGYRTVDLGPWSFHAPPATCGLSQRFGIASREVDGLMEEKY